METEAFDSLMVCSSAHDVTTDRITYVDYLRQGIKVVESRWFDQ